jgi:FKBP-type peptidyl-prolyl cis-trans isomerase FkpA
MARVFRSVWVLGSVMVLAAAAAACNSSPTSPSTNVPYSQTDLVVGTGTQVAAGSVVTVDYTGWFYNGSKSDLKGVQFDTSIGRGTFQFTVGGGSVIAGWDQGIVGMQVGGVRKLVVPPSLGYGATRYGSIPPYSTLVFEITLVAVQ